MIGSHVVILGAGTGGTSTANRLRKVLPSSSTITIVGGDVRHVYQPGLPR